MTAPLSSLPVELKAEVFVIMGTFFDAEADQRWSGFVSTEGPLDSLAMARFFALAEEANEYLACREFPLGHPFSGFFDTLTVVRVGMEARGIERLPRIPPVALQPVIAALEQKNLDVALSAAPEKMAALLDLVAKHHPDLLEEAGLVLPVSAARKSPRL
jgi:hypothetical protein